MYATDGPFISTPGKAIIDIKRVGDLLLREVNIGGDRKQLVCLMLGRQCAAGL
jgi:hypothetical protein